MGSLRVLVYGDINLNVIDGSAVWLTSILNVLSINTNIKIDLLLKTKITNKEMVSSINRFDEINKIEMFNGNSRLTVEEAVSNIKKLDIDNKYDCIILRGFALCKLISTVESIRSKLICYVTDFEHDIEKISKEERDDLRYIYYNCKYFCAQTEQARDSLKCIMDIDNNEKFIILNPMIPDYNNKRVNFTNINNRLIYSGKFARDWNTKEIIDAFKELYKDNNELYLTVVGSLFRQDLSEYRQEIIDTLENNKNINWIKGVDRNKSNELINLADVGIAWRSQRIDNDKSVELSTKVLEYCRAGKPILLNRIKMYEKLLGSDYPLFVNNEEEFKNKLNYVLTDEMLYRKCAKKVYEVGKKYTFTESYKRLHSKLWGFKLNKKKVVIAGHDLKFIQKFIEYLSNRDDFEIKVDKWAGHDKHDQSLSEECIEWADIIFCEWGLGNVAWYSKNKKPWQKLIVRMHGQERNTKYYNNFNYKNIDNIIVVSPYIYEVFADKIKIPRDKMKIIYNYVDYDLLNKDKLDNSKYNIGIVGICPKLKRLDIAVDILEKLVTQNKEYKLYIKGKRPEEYPWIMNRINEKKYYENIFTKIKDKGLQDNIIFDEHGNNMDEWFRKIGYILSTSDFESFHLAPAEGMCSGTIPVIRSWEGSDTIYEKDYIYNDVNEAVKLILKGYSNEDKNRYSKYVYNNFRKEKIFSEIIEVIEG